MLESDSIKNIFLTQFYKRGASFRWSFGPLSAWDSIESTTILTTHPSLNVTLNLFFSK